MGVFFQAEDGIRDLVRSRGLGDVYKRQGWLELRQLEEALVSVAEEQVHKIGQELHDNIGQQIAAIAYQASVLEVKINEVDSNITCLLYTSDAADERSSVDLGGRRIIKKKK